MSEDELTLLQSKINTHLSYWDPELRAEYLNYLQGILKNHESKPDFPERYQCLISGLPHVLSIINTRSTDRVYLDVHKAEIRWYTEQLMARTLLIEAEKKSINTQFQELINRCKVQLQLEFQSLPEAELESAVQDILSEFEMVVNNPLFPFVQRELTDKEVDEIWLTWMSKSSDRKKSWDPQITQENNATTNSHSVSRAYVFYRVSFSMIITMHKRLPTNQPDYFTDSLQRRREFQDEKSEKIKKYNRLKREIDAQYSTKLESLELLGYVISIGLLE